MDVAAVARRARTENFPVASLLFPRRLRPHLRRVYGFARLVDILGDEVEGDRLAALDELEREVEACYAGEPDVAGDAGAAADDPGVLAAARAVPAADRGEPDGPADLASTRPGTTCASTAATPPIPSAGSCSACCASTASRSSLPRATTSAPACSSSTSCRTCRATSSSAASTCRPRTGAASASPALDRPSPELTRGARFEAARARGLLAGGRLLQARIGGRVGRAVGLFARGGLAALDALERAQWDIFTQRPRPSRARLALAAFAR